jgi:hypothetical protein
MVILPVSTQIKISFTNLSLLPNTAGLCFPRSDLVIIARHSACWQHVSHVEVSFLPLLLLRSFHLLHLLIFKRICEDLRERQDILRPTSTVQVEKIVFCTPAWVVIGTAHERFRRWESHFIGDAAAGYVIADGRIGPSRAFEGVILNSLDNRVSSSLSL